MRLGLVSSAVLLVSILFTGSARGQQLLLSPTPLNFGKLTPGQTSATMTLYVENNSNSAITIGTVSLGGTNPGDFAIVTNSCGSSLTAFNICILTLDFAPTTYGARTATVTETSSIGTGTATLSGSGVPATFNPTTVLFPATAVGQTSTTETTTLTNNTSSALTITSSSVTAGYTITANTCTGTLAASPASCTVTMTFTPTTSGVVAGTLSVVDNIETETASLTGVGMAATSPAVAFPAEPVGTTASSTVTVTFAASTTLSKVSVLTQGVTGQDFNAGTQLGTACKAGTYSNGQTCTVVVNFKAGGTGRRQGSVLLYDTESTPQVVGTAYLQGVGTGANAVFYPGTGTTTLTFFSNPTSPVVDAAGNIVVGDSGGIYYMPVGAGYRYVIGPAGHASNLDGAGNVYYAVNNSVYEIPLIGVNPGATAITPILIATLPTSPDNSMMIDAAGDLFVPTSGTGTGGGIYEIAVGTHTVTNLIAQGAATSDGGTLGRTIGTFMDAAGDMYLADFTNSKIDEVLAGSTTVTVIQPYDAYLNNPYAITVDAAGDLFVTNYSGQPCTLKYALVSGAYNRSQYCNTIVGNYGVTLDSQENLVLLAGNNLTRYTRTATPTLAFPATAVGGTSATQTTNLENEGNAPLVFTSIAASSTNFSTAGTACTTTTALATGANCNVVASFTPLTGGALTGTANLVDNNLAAATATQMVPLTGTANYNLGFTTPPPASLQTGQSAGTVVAALENSNGSVNTSAPATSITLTITGPSGYTTTMMTGTTASGSVTFSLPTALTTTGTYTYALSDANGDTAASVNETVYPYKLALSGVATPQAASSSTNSVTVAITDNSGNATTQTNAITLVVTGPNSYSQTYGPAAAAANGAVMFTTAALSVPGTYAYTASSTASADGVAVTGASTSQVITPGAATTYAVTPASTTAVVGYPDNITVSAYDAYGNLATSYAGTVKLTSTDTAATLPANFTLISGTATKPVTFNTLTSTGWTVTATDTMNSLLTQTSGLIAVTPVPVFTVNSSAGDTSGACTNQAAAGSPAGTTTDSACTVYAAMAAVTALNNSGTASYLPVVNFVPSLNGRTITMTTAIALTGNVSVVGPGASLLTLSGGATGGGSFVPFITDSSSNSDIALSGLTFMNFVGSDGAIVNTVGSAGAGSFVNDVFTNNTATGGSYGGGVYNGYSLKVSGSTFTGNMAAGSQSGGVAKLGGGTNSFTNSVFTSNSADLGGAIYLTGGTLTLNGNTYKSNTAKQGGAVYSTGATIEAGSTYMSNTALNGTSGDGGAMDVAGTLSIANSTFNTNEASAFGGAIYASGVLTMTTGTSTFSGNYVSGTGSSAAEGGALYTNAAATISSVSFAGNYVSTTSGTAYGGAALMTSTLNAVTNSLFSGNYVSGSTSALGGAVYGGGKFTGDTFYGNSTMGATNQLGGAVYASSTTTLYNDTISGNTAKTGGGFYRGGGTTIAYNTVISGNTAATSYKDEDGVTASATDYIDTGTSATCTTNCTPLLSALGSYGGPVQTMVPLPGSPLLAAGTATGTPINSATTDGRGTGYPRTVSYNGAAAHTDIGAVTANYSLSFITQPQTTAVNAALLPPPTVQLFESGVPFGGTGGTLAVAAQVGTLYTTSAESTVYTGVATPANGLESLAPYFATPYSDDTLQVSVQSGAATPVTVASTTSEPFNIGDTSGASIHFSTPPAPTVTTGGNAGTVTAALTNAGGATNTSATAAVTLTVTGPASYSQTYGPTAAANGMVSFNLTGVTLMAAGKYTYTATASAYTADTATAPETVGGDSVWIVDASGTLVKLTTAGTLSTTVANANGTAGYGGVAFDNAGDVYSVNSAANTLLFAVYTGGSFATYNGGGLNAPVSVAVDGAGFVWIANSGNGTVSEFNDARSAMSPAAGYGGSDGLSAPSAVVLDYTGGVWVANKTGSSVTHIFGAATPVVTPLSSATASGTLGAKP